MRSTMLYVPIGLAVALAIAAPALANPNEAPDFRDALADQVGMPASTIEISELTGEDLSRDGLTASYYAGFEAVATSPFDFFAEVDRGDGYVVVQEVTSRGDPMTISGNVLGAYQDGAWQVQVNVMDTQRPGGRPLSAFSSGDTVALEAGSAELEAFLTARDEAMALAHELAMAEIAREAERDRLARELAREQEQRDAAAAAAAAEERRVFEREQEAKLVAERARADEMIMALFNADAQHTAQIAYSGQRVGGTFDVVRSTDEVLELTGAFPRGAEGTYETTATISLAPEAGVLHLEMPQINSWRGRRHTCKLQAAPNIDGGFVRFAGDYSNCHFELVIEGLGTPAEES